MLTKSAIRWAGAVCFLFQGGYFLLQALLRLLRAPDPGNESIRICQHGFCKSHVFSGKIFCHLFFYKSHVLSGKSFCHLPALLFLGLRLLTLGRCPVPGLGIRDCKLLFLFFGGRKLSFKTGPGIYGILRCLFPCSCRLCFPAVDPGQSSCPAGFGKRFFNPLSKPGGSLVNLLFQGIDPFRLCGKAFLSRRMCRVIPVTDFGCLFDFLLTGNVFLQPAGRGMMNGSADRAGLIGTELLIGKDPGLSCQEFLVEPVPGI